MRIDTNALGDRGEAILTKTMLTLRSGKPLFNVVFLGAKWPVADFVAELRGRPGAVFLIQAKATKSAVKGSRLPIRVSKAKLALLAGSRVPAYVVGIEDSTERVFICAATKPVTTGISGLPVTHDLRSYATRKNLFDEVATFWDDLLKAKVGRAPTFCPYP